MRAQNHVLLCGVERVLHIARRMIRREVEAGEVVIIIESGKPVAKIVTIKQPKRRRLGEDIGKGWVADDFDAPLPDDLQAYFEGRGE